jgi:hypothetical protein
MQVHLERRNCTLMKVELPELVYVLSLTTKMVTDD